MDGKSVGSVKSYTFKNVTKDHTIEVVFMKANGNPQTGVFVDVAEGATMRKRSTGRLKMESPPAR